MQACANGLHKVWLMSRECQNAGHKENTHTHAHASAGIRVHTISLSLTHSLTHSLQHTETHTRRAHMFLYMPSLKKRHRVTFTHQVQHNDSKVHIYCRFTHKNTHSEKKNTCIHSRSKYQGHPDKHAKRHDKDTQSPTSTDIVNFPTLPLKRAPQTLGRIRRSLRNAVQCPQM